MTKHFTREQLDTTTTYGALNQAITLI